MGGTRAYSGDLLNQVRRVTDAQNFIGLKNVIGLPIPVSARNAIFREFYDKNIDRVLAGVDAVKTAPNLAGYFIMDEPLPASLFDQYKFGQDLYARLHRADGYHPAIVNYSSFIPDGDQYTNWCDVLATDPYWYPPRPTKRARRRITSQKFVGRRIAARKNVGNRCGKSSPGRAGVDASSVR